MATGYMLYHCHFKILAESHLAFNLGDKIDIQELRDRSTSLNIDLYVCVLSNADVIE